MRRVLRGRWVLVALVMSQALSLAPKLSAQDAPPKEDVLGEEGANSDASEAETVPEPTPERRAVPDEPAPTTEQPKVPDEPVRTTNGNHDEQLAGDSEHTQEQPAGDISPRTEAADSDFTGLADPASAADSAGSKDEATRMAESEQAAILEALALEDGSSESLGGAYGGEEWPRLELYGFADFGFTLELSDGSWDGLFEYSAFASGNTNLYLNAQLARNWRSLAEVRFHFLPNGARDLEEDGSISRTDTSVRDPSDFERYTQWGGIEIERVWLEFVAHELLTIKGGVWLTPYGIWNVDHGSPTVIPVRRPYVVGEELVPGRQTGLQLNGRWALGANTLGYNLTISNGRGNFDEIAESDDNKAIGGRLYFETSELPGELQVGAFLYRGVFSELNSYASFVSTDPPEVEVINEHTVFMHELSSTAALKWTWQRFLLQGEVIVNDRAFEEGKRPVVDGSLRADHRRTGGYVLTGYRSQWLNTMPYVMGEYYNAAGDPNLSETHALTVGLNSNPVPTVTLKLQYFTHLPSLGAEDKRFRGTLRRVETQAAWAF